MNLNHLTYFLSVVDHGMLNRAAMELGISQPALTKAIRRLEEELGCTLFHRSSHGMELTELGQEFYLRARTLEARYNDVMSDMGDLKAGANSKIRLGVTTGGEHFVTRAYAALIETRPALQVVVKVAQTNGLVDMLESGEVDFAITPHPAFVPEFLRFSSIFQEETWIVGRAGHPLQQLDHSVSASELADSNWVLPSSELPGRMQLERFLKTHCRSRPRVAFQSEYGSPGLIYELIASSDLLGLCNHRVKPLADMAGLVPVRTPFKIFEPRLIGILMRKDRQLPPIGMLLHDEIRQQANTSRSSS